VWVPKKNQFEDASARRPAAPYPPPTMTPLVMIPVTAEDVRREKTRKFLKIGGVALLAVLVVAWVYKRSTDPIAARASYDAGTRLLESGRYQEAILAFSKALDLKSDYAEAYRMRGQVYFEETILDQAIHDYSAAIKIQPSDPRTLLDRAAVYLGVKNYAGAMADCDRALVLDSRLAKAYNLRGSARRAQGDSRGALADFDRAVALAPNMDNFYQRGATYQLLGEHEKAIADFTEVIARAPDLAAGYFARAEALDGTGAAARASQDRSIARKIERR
jgi:tetratricopeptide (TPR) repeat protein